MNIDYIKVIIVAVMAVVGIWADYITGQQSKEESVKATVKIYIQTISSSVILIVMMFDIFSLDAAEKWKNREIQVYGHVDTILNKAEMASVALDSLKNKSLRLDDRLQTFNDSFDMFAVNGLNYFQRINNSTISLTNPLPLTITVDCELLYRGNIEGEKYMKEMIKTKKCIYFPQGYHINNSMLVDDVFMRDDYRENLELIFYENGAQVLSYSSEVSLYPFTESNELYYDTLKNDFYRRITAILTVDDNHLGYKSVQQIDGKSMRLKYVSNNFFGKSGKCNLSIKFDSHNFTASFVPKYDSGKSDAFIFPKKVKLYNSRDESYDSRRADYIKDVDTLY